MKNTLKWIGLTTAAVFISLEAASIAANHQPSLSSDSVPNTELLAQLRRRLPGQGGNQQQVVRVPIRERSGGIPVIDVTFNGNRQFPMLVDTGASVTTITPEMARALRFKQEDTIEVRVANGQTLKVPVGRVPSIDVGGLVVNDFPVAVMSAPLLGQNFYGELNVIIAQNFVVFRPKLR